MTRRLFILCMGMVIWGSPISALAENEEKIALVMKALSNPFFIKMREGAVEYATNYEIPLEVFGIERETEVERQI